jgi:hypothetical protein
MTLNVRTFAFVTLIAAFAVPAFPSIVTYTTTGEFCTGPGACPDATPLVENPGINNTLVGGPWGPQTTYVQSVLVNNTVDISTPVQAPGARFLVAVIGSDPRTPPPGEVFTFYISQTNPAAGTASLVGGFSGNLAVGSNTATITFANTSIVLGGTVYTLDSNIYTFPTIQPPTHIDTLMMEVSAASPEPSFLMLSGLGFAGLAFVAYRRRRRVLPPVGITP